MDLIKSIIYVSNNKFGWYISRDDAKITPKRYRDDVSIYDKIYYFFSEPTHIIDNIYLGNGYNAANYSSLKNNKIDIIINATSELDNYYEYLNEFNYYKFNVLDEKDKDISLYFNDFIEVINKNPNKNILIHCYMGASRSACFVLLYLIKFKNMSYDYAMKYLIGKRTMVNINTNFLTQLNTFLNK